MKNKYDVVIVGAGPGGLSCAYTLQKGGKSVLLLEKNKEIGPKVCAGGLTTKIKKIGLSLHLAEILFRSINIHCADTVKKLSDTEPFVATIDRGRLGQILLKKIDETVDIQTGSEVAGITDSYIKVREEKIFYNYLVGADGSTSVVRKYLGLDIKKFLIALQYILPQQLNDLELFFDARLFGSGYAWIFPHKGYTSVGCGQDIRFVKNPQFRNNLDRWMNELKISTKNAVFQGKIINYDYRGYKFGNKFLVGDAAGFASGLTGEGIFFAMVSGAEVAKKY